MPLRTDGAGSLSTTGFPQFKKIFLIEVEVAYNNTFHRVDILRSDDMFGWLPEGTPRLTIPRTGELTRAIFKILFTDGHCVFLEVRTPDIVSCSSEADAPPAISWLAKSCFNRPAPSPAAEPPATP